MGKQLLKDAPLGSLRARVQVQIAEPWPSHKVRLLPRLILVRSR